MTQDEKSSILDYISEIKSYCDGISDSISTKVADVIPAIDDKTLKLFNVTREGLKEEAVRYDEHVRKIAEALTEFKGIIDNIECSEEEGNWEVYGTER